MNSLSTLSIIFQKTTIRNRGYISKKGLTVGIIFSIAIWYISVINISKFRESAEREGPKPTVNKRLHSNSNAEHQKMWKQIRIKLIWNMSNHHHYITGKQRSVGLYVYSSTMLRACVRSFKNMTWVRQHFWRRKSNLDPYNNGAITPHFHIFISDN